MLLLLLVLLVVDGRLFVFLPDVCLLLPLLADWFWLRVFEFCADPLRLDCRGLEPGLGAALSVLCLPVLAAEYSGCGGCGGW